MKRRLIAAAWIATATVPALLVTLFFVGCCVLPFHRVMHKLMPICHVAAALMRVDPATDQSNAAQVPERDRNEPAKRILSITSAPSQPWRQARIARASTPTAHTAYRSFISHGAARCDDDIGLHVLVSTFLI